MTAAGDALLPAYRLRLFVAGSNARSRRTIANLRGLCAAHLAGRVELEVVDIYQQPQLAEQDQVVAAPTLVKLAPPPLRRIIGDLSDEARVMHALGLPRDGTNALSSDGTDERSLDRTDEPSLDRTDEPSLDGAHEPSLDGANEPSLDGR